MKGNLIIALCAAGLWISASSAGAITYKGDLETEESIAFPEQTTPPGSPPAGQRKLYFKDDGGLYQLDASGNENPVLRGGFKNAVINGNGEIDQRGGPHTNPANGAYTVDRFFVNTFTGTGTLPSVDISSDTSQTWSTNQTHAIKLDITNAGATGSGTVWKLIQKIENPDKFANQTVTLRVRIKASTTIDNINSIGISDGVSLSTAAIGSVSTSEAEFTLTKTVDSSPSQLSVQLILMSSTAPSTSGALYITDIQLEVGSVATEFERRPIAQERALCQRYYTELGDGIDGQVLPGSSTDIALSKGFPVEMRSAPSVSILTASPAIVEIGGAGSKTGSGSAIAGSWIGSQAAVVRINGFSGLTGGRQVVINNSGVPVISFDAEL